MLLGRIVGHHINDLLKRVYLIYSDDLIIIRG
jgi:hypothetical protein